MSEKIDLLINASILSDRNTGLGIYTYQLLENIVPELQSRNISFEIMCKEKEYLPSNCRNYFHKVEFKGFASRLIKTSLEYKNKYKLVWSTTQHGAIFSRTKQIVTVHDITPILYPQGRWHQLVYYRAALPILIKRCTSVFTVSEATKDDLVKKYNVNPQKIFVGYESFTRKKLKNNSLEESLGYGLEKEKYFVIIGIHFEYKNLHSIINTYAKFKELQKYKVVIIGNDNCSYAEFLKKLISENNLNDSFIFTGFIDSNEKNLLIKNAIACVFPSLYEGFGLPILESMNMGVPVACSNVSSLPEVGGEAAVYFDPTNIDDIGKTLLNITSNNFDRGSVIKKGFENIERFNWNEISKKIADEVEEIIGNFN